MVNQKLKDIKMVDQTEMNSKLISASTLKIVKYIYWTHSEIKNQMKVLYRSNLHIQDHTYNEIPLIIHRTKNHVPKIGYDIVGIRTG